MIMDDVSKITNRVVAFMFKGFLWQFYKLGLKVPSGRDKNNGIGHFAELGSSWPGEAKTWPKIALRYVLRDGRPRKKSTVFEDGRVHGLSWPAGAEFGKMTYTIGFVSARRNF